MSSSGYNRSSAWCWALSVGPSPATASRAFLSTPCIRPGWSTRGSSRSIG